MKEKEEYFNYVWVCAEIGKIKRDIKENERLLLFLEKSKSMYEKNIDKKSKKKVSRRYND